MPKRIDAGASKAVPKAKVAKTKATAKKPRVAANGHKLPDPIPLGEILADVAKKQWRLGKSVGVGGFGEIYIASDDISKPASENSAFVIKIEPHNNGPLFTEMHFYNRAAKSEMIEEWKIKKKLKILGMPKFIAFGSHELNGTKYRFLVMQRFGDDLQKKFLLNKKKFSLKTVLTLGIKLMDILEFIHHQGYIHADIKASNLLLGYGKEDEVFLVDYGLACKYLSEGRHKPYLEDPRKAHDGTIEFTSRDAHVGAHSRRGDLEILGYNMVQWLCGSLPWEDNLTDPQYVAAQKNRFMKNIPDFLETSFKHEVYPDVIEVYLKYVASLAFEQEPGYDYCKKLFSDGLQKAKLKNDGKLDLAFKISPSKRKTNATLQKSENENSDSDLPTKQARSGRRRPCGLAQTNRSNSRSQESLANNKVVITTLPKLENPTPAMLQVMQRKEGKLQQQTRKRATNSRRPNVPTAVKDVCQRKLRSASSQSSISSPEPEHYSLSPELF